MLRNELGISTSIFRIFQPEKLRLLSANGVKYVELSTNCYETFQQKQLYSQLCDILEETGLAVNSIHVPFSGTMDISSENKSDRQATIDAAKFCIEKLAQLKGRCIVIHPSWEPVEDHERARRLDLCRSSLDVIGTYAISENIQIAVEHLPRACLGNTSLEITQLVESLNGKNFGICQDVNHCNLQEDLVKATVSYGQRIITVHISDNDGIDERHWMPGLGVIAWKEWMQTLVNAGYTFPFTYELTPWCIDEPEMIQKICTNSRKNFCTNS